MLTSSYISSLFYATSHAPSSFALQFDGSQNYVDFGTLGDFGNNITTNNSFYLAFDMKTSATTVKTFWGKSESGNRNFELILNGGAEQGKLKISIGGTNKDLAGFFTNTAIIDDSWHTITWLLVPSANTIVATVDGVNQDITYDEQETPTNIANFTQGIYLGRKNVSGTPSGNFPGLLDNFKMGYTASNLVVDCKFNEGTGTVATDASGNGNNGTLSGNPVPTYVTRS